MDSQSSYITNGRVDILTPNTCKLFEMYDKIPANQCTTLRNPTEGLWENTELSKAFFSYKNIEILQNAIRAGVYKQSNQQYLIDQQDCDVLKIIMRGVFLEHASNQPTHTVNQIISLNQLVLNYCIPQILSEAKGYMQYLVDASTMYTPIAHPVLAKEYDKTLELKPWF